MESRTVSEFLQMDFARSRTVFWRSRVLAREGSVLRIGSHGGRGISDGMLFPRSLGASALKISSVIFSALAPFLRGFQRVTEMSVSDSWKIHEKPSTRS